jgi:cytidyltransferase-like protein
MKRKILIMGLPGAGKTTLANAVAARLNAVHFNADEIRRNINKDLGFSISDRVEQARRLGWLCDQVTKTGNLAIADFICPTHETRRAFFQGGEGLLVWIDRVKESRFSDTDRMFEPPLNVDLRVMEDGTPEYWSEQIAQLIRPIFDPKKPTALFVGRYQPFHKGHKALIEEGLRRVDQVCIAVRDTGGTSSKDPFGFENVKARIEHGMREHEGRYAIVPLPNIEHIFYGRDVGYSIERIDVNSEIEAISATDMRRLINKN